MAERFPCWLPFYFMLLRIVSSTVVLLGFLQTGCGPEPVKLEDFNTRVVTLPNGFKVRAEVMTHPQDMMRGMMFRNSLEEGRGMLFLHAEPGLYPYWMYQVRIPLDILWLDRDGRIVEVAPDTPPCPSKSAMECPNYGGTKEALTILELPAGSIAKHGLRVGDRLRL